MGSKYCYVVFDGCSYHVCDKDDLTIKGKNGKQPEIINRYPFVERDKAAKEAERLNYLPENL